jgi:hypothetical protein
MSNPLDVVNWDATLQPQNTSAPESGSKLELRTYDIRENSKGDKVPLETAKTIEFRNKADKDYSSAMVVTKTYHTNGTLKQIELVIRSPHIKTAMMSVIKQYPGMNIADEKITIIGQPRCLFHFRKELLTYGRGLRDRTATEHLAFALNYMQTALADDIVHHKNCIAKHSESPGLDFKRLWMEYRPGDLIFVKSTSVSWVGRLTNMRHFGFLFEKWVVSLERIMWQGEALYYFAEEVLIYGYVGFKCFQDLPAFPLKYHHDHQSITKKLVDRGNRFLALKGVHQRFYNGTARWASDRKSDLDNDEDCHFEMYKVRSRQKI